MSTEVRGTKRKPVSARGKAPGTSKMSGRAPAADITAADNNKESENVTSVEDAKEELYQVVTVQDVEEKPNGLSDAPDDKPEQPVDKTEDVLFEVIDESENKEVGLELVPEDMNTVEDNPEGDEFADCVLEDVLLIDSEDGIDEDPIPSNESDKDLAKPTVGISDDDMVEFLKSLGLTGAVGFLELSITGVPLIHIVAAETREVRQQRKVVLHLVKPLDFASPVLQDVINSDKCIHLRIDCDRPLHDVESWTGELELYFGSAAAAAAAAESLHKMRDGIEVDYGQPLPLAESNAAEQNKILEDEMKPWIDLILIVKNIGTTSESSKAKLAEMFPDADIAFHKDSAAEFLRGQAYLVFSSKQKVEEAIKKFKSERPRLDDRRLILIRWNPKRVLPIGMLRIGERRLVMLTMLQMENRLAKGDDPSLNAKYKALGDIVARDTKSRHACGIPAPSYNQLKALHDVRNYTDAEQALILHRLMQPYNCGDIDIVPSNKISSTSRPAPTKSRIVTPAARNKPAAKGTTAVPRSETNKKDESKVLPMDISTDDEKSSSSTPKKTAGRGAGKDPKPKSEPVKKPLMKNTKPMPTNRRWPGFAAARPGLASKPQSLLEMPPVRPRMNVGSGGLLGVRPPMNDPAMRMPGPLLQAPYELLPAPSRLDRGPPPPSPPPPPRPMMRVPSPVGFRREPSPPNVTSNRGSLLGNFPGELEMMGSRHGSRPLLSDRMEDPVPKMRRMDDDRPPLMRPSPDYDRRPNYLDEEQDRFRSDHRARPIIGQMPEDRDDRQRKVISIFDIDERLQREDYDRARRDDVDNRGRVGGGGYRRSPERFDSRRDDNDEMLEMQFGRPLMRGSAETRIAESRMAEPRMAERRMGSWDDGRAVDREQPMQYERRVEEDRRMPPSKNHKQIPSLVDAMDRDFLPERRQQRMPAADSMMMGEPGPKHLGRDRSGPTVQDDFKPSTYYQSEPAKMQSGRAGIAERGSSYGMDRDDRNRGSSDRMERFGSFEKEETKSASRQSNQPAQSSEQSDPVSLLLNLSQLLADKLQRDKHKDTAPHRGDY